MSPRALALAALVACACATSAPARPSTPPPAAMTATPDAGAPVVAPASAPTPPTQLEREGLAVFMRVCGPCHMAMWHVPSGGTLSATERSEAAVRRLLREGSGDGSARRMPPLGVDVLPERELSPLFAWLRAMRVVGAP